jgi:hypothetical protein
MIRGDVEWIRLRPEDLYLRAPLDAEMNLWVPQNAATSFTTLLIVSPQEEQTEQIGYSCKNSDLYSVHASFGDPFFCSNSS